MRRSLLCVSTWLTIGFAAPAHALLIAPALDDNRYGVLRSEVLSRIPEYAPGWTDHNTHDPGATLLELFAFTIDDLTHRIALDIPQDLLWADYDAEEESTLGAVAYLLLDAAYLARSGNDVREQDWLVREGIDPDWTYAELRSAAIQAVPEPGPLVLLATGLLLVVLRRRPPSPNSN